ncbi:MAG: ATP-dependent DNA helicase RecG [Clostridiales Family XIII bacterium]|jgi:ATP-dependent DNA helicase RecG|nr:ATP-dependent DNA helicase RecG [Clostridiales Family XIII bacterium]
MPTLTPHEDVSSLKGVGPKKRAALSSAGIETVADLLTYFPRTWEDRRNRVKVSGLEEQVPAGFTARVLSVKRPAHSYRSGRRTPLVITAGDETGAVEIVFFQSHYMERIFLPGGDFYFFGTPARNYGKLTLIHPEFERVGADSEFGGYPIVPVYPLKAGISQLDMRRWHRDALGAAAAAPDILPKDIVSRLSLCGRDFALTHIHFPADRHALSAARYRLIFEELFLLATALGLLRERNAHAAPGIAFSDSIRPDDFSRLLPFGMTGAQARTVSEIYADMESERQMNRLVQGDVGSGKTAVAMAAAYKAARDGYQSVLMAPTEILATQHYAEFLRLFGAEQTPAAPAARSLRIRLLTASVRKSERDGILAELAAGAVDILIGTHALLQPDVVFGKLGLVITDEQHRFGVNQRIGLSEKGETQPDILVMTATPIPRTLAFILYGDLDVSLIDELPPGRKPVATKAVGSGKRGEVYKFAATQVAKGHQVYVVCPLIEENTESEAMAGVRSAGSVHAELSRKFPGLNIALLHGTMKQAEKDGIMEAFTAGEIPILVSTVVIEVGVNVPNATIMIVENSERFGLAQLHQLRGRVGRGASASYCVLITDSTSEEALTRAKIMTETNDGFVIAEKDLEMRGPGEFFGVRQHGLPELKISDMVRNASMLETVKQESARLLTEDPRLEGPENAALKRGIEDIVSNLSNPGL